MNATATPPTEVTRLHYSVAAAGLGRTGAAVYPDEEELCGAERGAGVGAAAAVDGNTRGTEILVGTRRVLAPIQKSGLTPQRLKFARIFFNRSFSLT